MKIRIQSLHFTANKALTDFVNEKVSKLFHHSDRIESAEVCLKLVKSDKRENKVCEIRLLVPGNDLFVEKQCATFEEATNECVEALQNQLYKMKTVFENSRYPKKSTLKDDLPV